MDFDPTVINATMKLKNNAAIFSIVKTLLYEKVKVIKSGENNFSPCKDKGKEILQSLETASRYPKI